jgi:hypothetical protein
MYVCQRNNANGERCVAIRGADGGTDQSLSSSPWMGPCQCSHPLTAHALAYARASRPKTAKLVTNLVLRGKVEADLAKKYSPEQIAGRLKVDSLTSRRCR